MKKVFCVLTVLIVLVSFTASARTEKKPIKLKAVQFLNLGNPGEKGYHLLIDMINKGAKGELSIKIAGGPEAIPARQQPEAIRTGAVDMVWVPCSWYRSILPEAAIMNLSRLLPWEERASGWHDYLVEKHKKVGIRFLGVADVIGPFFMYAKEPIKSPAGLKGKRFRHSPTYVFFKDFGIIPVTAGHSEIYTGLERNLFDGLAIKHMSFIRLNLQEVCKYVIGPGFWPRSSTVILMNEKKFQSLPKHLQDLIVDSQKKAERPMIEEIQRENIAKEWQLLKKHGVTHVKWSPEDTKFFLDKVDKVTLKARSKKIPAEELPKIMKMMGQ
ncbi:MAG: TRAP transporter substrate-binding protein DctP [Deltaproteobacteria bacterium]|nr:TRAP transporter substrate-binding protein DctP [Deltaproteobacteria bacterium]